MLMRVALLLCTLISFVTWTPARAAGGLESKLANRILDVVLESATIEGRPLASLLAKNLGNSEFAPLRLEIEARVSELETYLLQRRLQGQYSLPAGALTAEEATFLREIAPVAFRFKGAEGNLEFLDGTRVRMVDRIELELKAMDKALPSTASDLERGARSVKRFFRELNDCRSAMPVDTVKKQNFAYLMEQVAISGTVSIGTKLTQSLIKHRDEVFSPLDEGVNGDTVMKVVETGFKVVDWRNLATSALMGMIWTYKGTSSIMQAQTFGMRWIRMVGWNQVKGVFDAAAYVIMPIQDNATRKDEPIDVAIKRMEFSAIWGVGNAITPVTLYTVLGGLECLYPTAEIRKISKGIRLGTQIGTSLLFFTLQGEYLD